MNLQIKDKFPLIELSTAGSKARRYVKPNVLIAGGLNKRFVQGDMLDANATYNLINEILYGESARGVDVYLTLEEFKEALDKQGEISDAVVYYILDEGLIYMKGNYYKFGKTPKSIALTQEEYGQIEQIDPTATYYILS